MKKLLRMPLALSLSVLLSVPSVSKAQETVSIDRNGNPKFVKFSTLKNAGSTLKGQEILSRVYKTTNNDEFRLMKTEEDKIGYRHERFQQYYKGLKVENGKYILHSSKLGAESLSGDFKVINDISTTPSISEKKATELAIKHIDAQEYIQSEAIDFHFDPELVIVANDFGKQPDENHAMVLAYKIDVYASKPLSRNFVYIDAKTGKVVHIKPLIFQAQAQGTAATRYSGTKTISTDSYGSSYRLRDYSRGNGIMTYNCNESTSYSSAVDFTDNDNNWTSGEYHNSDKDDGALEAHWAGMMTYDYFKDVHGRNSFDGNGAAVKAYIHYDKNYENAYWNGSVLTFGDGASTFDILASLDVYGHEFGHAVCSYTCDLTYSGESGALNEAFSDIWGCAIEYKYAPNKDNWVMGEDLGYSLRNISNPNAKNLPDTYKGNYWATGSADYYGVHTNNGPFCYWFYLISEGGSGTNDNGDSYSVSAIGIEKAEKIAYRIEAVYMTSSSDYADARTYAIQASKDLYGANSAEEKAVTNAMYAIGVGDAYEGGGGTTPDTEAPSAPSNLKASSITSSSLILSWNASSDNVGVKNYTVYKNGSAVGTTASTSYSVSGLAPSTSYQFSVKAKDNAGNTSAASKTITATTADSSTTPTPTSYCTSKGGDASYEWIDLVEIGGMKNTSGSDGGYADNTDKVATIGKGNNTIYLSCGFKSSSYTEYWKIWIDINQDGTFDSGELYESGSSSSSGTLTGTINIPSSAKLGQTRMRISMKYKSSQTACESFSYGEVEDYTVNIVNSAMAYGFASAADAKPLGNTEEKLVQLYPNPTSDYVFIECGKTNQQTEILLYDASGRLVHSESVCDSRSAISVSSLNPGVYTIVIDDTQKRRTERFIKK